MPTLQEDGSFTSQERPTSPTVVRDEVDATFIRGTLTTVRQPNITSVGNLVDLTIDDALTVGGLVQTVLSATGSSGLNVPHGAAPTSPVNGDVWTTTAGLFVRVNGSTVGPLS